MFLYTLPSFMISFCVSVFATHATPSSGLPSMINRFLLIEKNRKCVDLVQLNNATLRQAAQAAELLFEV